MSCSVCSSFLSCPAPCLLCPAESVPASASECSPDFACILPGSDSDPASTATAPATATDCYTHRLRPASYSDCPSRHSVHSAFPPPHLSFALRGTVYSSDQSTRWDGSTDSAPHRC